MTGKRIVLIALTSLTLASCSFAISIPSSTASTSSAGTSSAGTSSAGTSSGKTSSAGTSSGATSSAQPGIEKTEMRQVYSDFTENNIYPIDSAPTLGQCHLLVIPIWFTDSSTYIKNAYRESVREDIENAYFGDEGSTGWHSVKSFYETESAGLLDLDGTVSEWYEVGVPMSTYGASKAGAELTIDLANDAADWFFTNNPSEKRSDYDADGDGFLDGVMLIYAAPDYVTGKKGSWGNFWAYCYWVQDMSKNDLRNPGANVFFWASYDFMYDSKTAQQRTGSSLGAGDTSYCDIDAHTFIHEMGHVFGLDDYYDYGPNGYSPAAGFSMQDLNVGGHDPFSVMAYGWADPYIPTESCQIEIGAFQSTHDLILLTPEWNEYDSPFDEYLLLELYTPTGLNAFDTSHAYCGGYPRGATVPGIRLWHVDARLLYLEKDEKFLASQMTSNVEHPCYYGVTQAFSNTSGNEDYGSPLGSDYDDYNLLQLVRNSKTATMRSKAEFQSSDLFRDGSSFSLSSYSKQFVKSTKMNNGKSLGWSFSVSISGSGDNAKATISLTKE